MGKHSEAFAWNDPDPMTEELFSARPVVGAPPLEVSRSRADDWSQLLG